MIKSNYTKILCIVLAAVTLLSVFASTLRVEAASLKRVSGVKTYNSTKYIGKFGNSKVYAHYAGVKWKSVSGADYYELRYRDGNCKLITKKVYKTSFDFTGYNAHGFGATWTMPYYYNIQIRAVDVKGGKTIYGPWSLPKTAWC